MRQEEEDEAATRAVARGGARGGGGSSRCRLAPSTTGARAGTEHAQLGRLGGGLARTLQHRGAGGHNIGGGGGSELFGISP